MAQGSSEGWDGPIQRLMKALDPYGEVASYSGERVLRDRQTDELNAATEAAAKYRATVERLAAD